MLNRPPRDDASAGVQELPDGPVGLKKKRKKAGWTGMGIWSSALSRQDPGPAANAPWAFGRSAAIMKVSGCDQLGVSAPGLKTGSADPVRDGRGLPKWATSAPCEELA